MFALVSALRGENSNQGRRLDATLEFESRQAIGCDAGIRIKAGDWMRRWTKNSTRKETQRWK
jgi:hypothetical protein